MNDTNLIYAIAVIAVMALVGRVIINKYKGGNIAWKKLGFIGLMVVSFTLVYFTFDPYSAKMWWDGEASLADAKSENIAGREAGKDIPHFASSMDDNKGRYYTLDTKEIEPTGYYCLKSLRDLTASIEREERVSQNDRKVISRKTSMLEVTRNPGDRADKYLPIYKVTLEGQGSILACMREADANKDILPVGALTPMSDKLEMVRERTNEANDTIIADYYFLMYNTDFHDSISGFNELIYKAIAGIIAAIVIAIMYNLARRRWRKTA